MYGGPSSSSPPRAPPGTGHHHGRPPPPISTSPQRQQHVQQQLQYQHQVYQQQQQQNSPYGSSMRQRPRYPGAGGSPVRQLPPQYRGGGYDPRVGQGGQYGGGGGSVGTSPHRYGPPSPAMSAGSPSVQQGPPPGVRFQDDGDSSDSPSFLFDDDGTALPGLEDEEGGGPHYAERHAVPTESQLTLLCLDYLRDLRRAYPEGEDMVNAEGLDADYVALAAWALSRAFVRWVSIARFCVCFFGTRTGVLEEKGGRRVWEVGVDGMIGTAPWMDGLGEKARRVCPSTDDSCGFLPDFSVIEQESLSLFPKVLGERRIVAGAGAGAGNGLA